CRLRQHGADAGMRILDIEHRVLVATRQGKIDIEYELGIRPPLNEEIAYRVLTHPVYEIPHGDIAAGALGDLHFGAIAYDLDHFVEDVGRVILGNADVQRLQPGPDARDSAVVITALDIDGVV